MTALSRKARRFIESGVEFLPLGGPRMTWVTWAATHPIRRDSLLETGEPLPPAVISVALSAVELKIRDLERRREYASKDEVFLYDNDISYAHAIEAALRGGGGATL